MNTRMLKTSTQDRQEKLISDVRNGQQLLIVNRGWSTSNLTQFFDAFVIRTSPATRTVKAFTTLERVTGTVADMCGFTYNRKREALAIGGGGYNKASHIMAAIFRKCGVDTLTPCLSV